MYAFLFCFQEVIFFGTSGAFFSSGYPKNKTYTQEISRTSLGEIEPHTLYKPGTIQMRVPSLPPSNLDGCRWINLIYYLLVSETFVISVMSERI